MTFTYWRDVVKGLNLTKDQLAEILRSDFTPADIWKALPGYDSSDKADKLLKTWVEPVKQSSIFYNNGVLTLGEREYFIIEGYDGHLRFSRKN